MGPGFPTNNTLRSDEKTGGKSWSSMSSWIIIVWEELVDDEGGRGDGDGSVEVSLRGNERSERLERLPMTSISWDQVSCDERETSLRDWRRVSLVRKSRSD